MVGFPLIVLFVARLAAHNYEHLQRIDSLLSPDPI